MKRKGRLLFVRGLVFLVQAGGIAWSQVTERVSVDSAGAEGNNASAAPSTSSDGRHVAFESFATNLVAGDGNGFLDVFVYDRQTGTTTRVSVDSAGVEGDDISTAPSISSDGRYVAFESDATNLVGIDTNAWSDIFVHDRDADDDGFYDDENGILDPGEVSTVRVSVVSDGTESIDPSNNPSISSDGRYVAFESGGELDLTAIEFLLFPDIFVHDRDTDGDGIYDEPGQVSTIRVSEDSVGNEADAASSFPSISADGRYVAFESIATNLVPPGVSNGFIHIFVHDRDADGNGIYDEAGGISTLQVSVDSVGAEGNAGSAAPSISGDGRYVAFVSDATNLVGVGNDTNVKSDVFVHDRDADGNGIYDEPGPVGVSTARVSVDSVGNQGNENSNSPSISSDGRYVAFESDADNLVANDNNVSADVFVHDRQTGVTTRASVDLAGVEGNGNSNSPSMSADGKSVTFKSDADNLVAGDTNTAPDIFVDDLPGAGGGGGSNSGGGGCFISTAADRFGW